MHKLLAIDTSSEACSIALSMHGKLWQRHEHLPLKHAELLLPAVNSVLSEAGASLQQLDAIVFGQGPGSFTSLRIGIGAVKGLAWGADLPVIPVSSLAAVAQSALNLPHNKTMVELPHFILAVMDARMEEVFHGVFSVSEAGVLTALGEEAVSSPVSVMVDQVAVTLGAGNGFQRYDELVELGHRLKKVEAEVLPTGEALIHLAEQWLLKHQPLPAGQAQAVYIRNKVAEKPRLP